MGRWGVKWTKWHTLITGLLVIMATMLAYQLRIQGIFSQCNDVNAHMRERLQYRRRRIKEACEIYGYDSYQYRWGGDFSVDGVFWRKNPKVASTYMATLLLRRIMENSTYDCEVDACHVMLDEMTEAERRAPVEFPGDRPVGEGGSLLIVRRPYSRIVSGYVDKIAGSGNAWLWEDIHRVSGQSNSTGAPSFAAFVDYLIWLDETDQVMDMHFEPQERLSRVCETDFQYVVQLESLPEEMPYVVRMLGLEREARQPVRHRNVRRQPYSTSDYMSQLSERQLEKLDTIYRMDIILFNG